MHAEETQIWPVKPENRYGPAGRTFRGTTCRYSGRRSPVSGPFSPSSSCTYSSRCFRSCSRSGHRYTRFTRSTPSGSGPDCRTTGRSSRSPRSGARCGGDRLHGRQHAPPARRRALDGAGAQPHHPRPETAHCSGLYGLPDPDDHRFAGRNAGVRPVRWRLPDDRCGVARSVGRSGGSAGLARLGDAAADPHRDLEVRRLRHDLHARAVARDPGSVLRGGEDLWREPWQMFRDITLPRLMGIVLVVVLLRSVFMFNKFDIIWQLTEGGPGNATTTLPVLPTKPSTRTRPTGSPTRSPSSCSCSCWRRRSSTSNYSTPARRWRRQHESERTTGRRFFASHTTARRESLRH